VKGAILNYHFNDPNNPDALYVCLDIPAVKTPHERSVQLPEEPVSQVPSEIINKITQLCKENQIDLGIIMDYELYVASTRESYIEAGEAWNYYRNAPTEEIIRFASIGTKIAFNLHDMIENREITLTNPEKLAGDILSRLKEELGDKYFWLREAFQFVCNPMDFDDSYLWTLTAS
jgi:hypothetical protein